MSGSSSPTSSQGVPDRMRVLIVEDDLHIKIFRMRTLELGARNGLMGILTSLALFRAQALFEVAS